MALAAFSPSPIVDLETLGEMIDLVLGDISHLSRTQGFMVCLTGFLEASRNQELTHFNLEEILIRSVLSVADDVEAVAVVRGYFIAQFELDVVFPTDPLHVAPPQNAQVGIATVASVFRSMISAGCKAVSAAAECTSDFLWSMVRKAFESALAGHYDLLIKAAHWVTDVWDRMKAWCDEITKETAKWLAGFNECVVLGVGIIGVSAVLMLIEKFMLGSNLLSNSMNFAQTFLMCFVAFVGVKTGGAAVRSYAASSTSALISACKSLVKSISDTMIGDGSIGSAGQNPVALLESFAQNLASFNSGTIIQTGRVFNAVSQVKTGCATIWDSVHTITDFLWNMLDYGFGIQSRALADLSVMLGKDVQGWLRRCDAACEHLCLFPSVPHDTLTHFRVLRHNGQEIKCALVSRPERGSAVALTSVTKALEKLDQLLNAAILSGSGGPRYEPMWVALHGRAGVGKSTATNALVARYLDDMNLDTTEVYARNTTDPFWSGYRRQHVVTYDDLGALSSEHLSEESELVKLVSRDPVRLNMAAVEEKGMHFDSPLIITSSNFMGYSPHAGIHDSEAYYRRRTMLVEVLAREGCERDPSNPVGHQKYVLRNSSEPFDVLQEFETFDDFYAFFLDRKAKHDQIQTEMMKALKHRVASLGTKVDALLTLTPFLFGHVPVSIEEFVTKNHPGWRFLVYHAGKMYLVNEQYELRIETHFPGVEKEDLKRAQDDALTVAMRYSQILKSMPNLDPMATHFLADLVSKSAFTSDLEVRKRLEIEDEQLHLVAVDIDRWQRALVYVLSDAMATGKGGFFSGLYDAMCLSLQKAYMSDVRQWPMAVKIGLGLTAFLVFGKTILWTLSYLSSFGSGAALTVAATRAFSMGQSDDEVRKKTSEYRHRNAAVRVRHWSKAQNFGSSSAWLMRNCLATLLWGHHECQVLMLPGKKLVGVHHFLMRIPDGVILKIIMDEQTYHICWHKKNLKQLEGSELSVYTHPTLRDVASSVSDRIVFGAEHLPDDFPAVMCSCKYDDVEKAYVPECAGISVRKRNSALNIYAGEYQRKVPVCLEYAANTVNKDCGSLIIANINGVDRLVGVHVAGYGGFGQACFLPLELEETKAQNWFEDHYTHFEVPDVSGNGTQMVGLMKEQYRFHPQQKTSLMATPEEWHLGTECDVEPAILSKFDPRLVGTEHADYDPYRKGLEKYRDAAGPFDLGKLEVVEDQIVEEWYDAAENFDFSECSQQDAINGVPGVDYYDSLVLNTSEGYPYMLSRQNNKGKARFLVEENGNLVPNEELQKGIDAVEEMSKYRVPVLVGVECAKDEKLPKRKIYDEPKTRLFTVLPMDYNIVVRKKFFPFVRFLMKSRSTLPCQVGLNPYGREWGRVAWTLLEKGNKILCCDYSRFDGILPKQVMWKISEMINRLMGGSLELCTQRENLLMACVGRYGICAGKVWRVENGIPSGFPLTVIINSVFNEIIVRYLYVSLFWEDRLMRSLFSKYVALVTYGDDNLISVSDAISSEFDGKYIQETARDLGIKITDGVDKTLPTLSFRTLEQCDFLKRSFKKDNQGLWRAPMELSSLWGQLHWVKTKHLGLHEAYLVNVESVLRELFLHDVGMAKSFRSKVLKLEWVLPSHVPTMEQIAAFHDMQMHGRESSAYAYDMLLHPTMLGPLGSVKEDCGDFEFRGLVATVSGSYKYLEGDFVICLKVASKYGSNGLFVDWPTTSGRGELPTAAWIRANIIRKNCEFLKKLKHVQQDGRRIVFLARNSNVYAAVFLVLVGYALKIITLEESNVMLSKAINLVGSLGYLPDVFPEFFAASGKQADVITTQRRSVKVFNSSPSILGCLRRAGMKHSLEMSTLAVPTFVSEDPKLQVDYVKDFAPCGLLVSVAINIPELDGLPSVSWSEWLMKKTGKTYDPAWLVIRLTYYDATSILTNELKCECQVVQGHKLFDAIRIKGRFLRDLYGPENPFVQCCDELMSKISE